MEEKLKLVKLTKNSWHYRLIRFIFGQAAPDPREMTNLCPYFWILVAALLLTPIFTPFILIGKVLRGIENWAIAKAEISAKQWLKRTTAYDIQCLHDKNYYRRGFDDFHIPKKVLKSEGWERGNDEKYYYEDVFFSWAKLNIKKIKTREDFHRFEWNKYFKDVKEQREKDFAEAEKERIALMNRLAKEKAERAKRKEEFKEKFVYVETGLEKFFDSIGNFFSKLKPDFSNWGNVIKYTKRFIGLVISLGIMGGVFYLVNVIALGIMWVIKAWDHSVFMEVLTILGIFVGIVLVAVGIVWFIKERVLPWFDKVVKKYENGRKVWWVEVFKFIGVYVIFWPIRIAAWWPIYYIFVLFLWKLVCVKVLWEFIAVRVIWGALRGFWKGLLSFMGIFGEYFGASYGDYCPGIEWED